MMTIEQCKIAKLALADRLRGLGYSPGMASELAGGKRKPSIETAANIEARLGIRASIWATRVPLKEVWDQIKRTSE